MNPVRLAVLLSGRGSNFRALHDAALTGRLAGAEIVLVVSNHAEAGGLTYAREQGLAAACFHRSDFPTLEAYDQAMLAVIADAKADALVLAGYDRILSHVLLDAYPGRILNIHPSLLPAYGGKGMVGMRVHEAVVSAGEAFSGCTVHLVTAEVDGGPILGQARVAVSPQDTAQTLAEKILAEEHRLYPTVVAEFVRAGLRPEAMPLKEALA